MRACLATAILAFELVACGYAPVRRGSGGGLRVTAVRNDTAQAEASGIFAIELRSELGDRGLLQRDDSGAAEMQAELVSLSSFPTAAGSEGAAAFRIEARLRVRAPGFSDEIVGSEDYLAGIDVLGTEANRRAALRRVARTIAREAIERMDVQRSFAR